MIHRTPNPIFKKEKKGENLKGKKESKNWMTDQGRTERKEQFAFHSHFADETLCLRPLPFPTI